MKYAAAMLCLLVAPLAHAGPAPDVTLTWVEKYLTYAQDHQDRLTPTDAHFLAEIIFDSDRDFDAITPPRAATSAPMSPSPRGASSASARSRPTSPPTA